MRRSPSSHACRVVELRQAILQAKEFASKLQGGAAILNALSELEILPFGYDGEPVDGEGWYALLDCGEVRAGQRLYLADTDATVVDDRAIFSLEGRICDAFWSKADSVADVLRDHHTGLLGSDPGDGGGTDDDGARASFYASIHERLQLAGCPVPEPGPSASHLTPTPPAGPPPASIAAARKRQSEAAWDEHVLRTVRARAHAGADSSSMTNLPDGVDSEEDS